LKGGDILSNSSFKIKFKTKPNALKNAINKSIINSQFNITCPNCKTSFPVQGSQFGQEVICPSCRINIRLNNNGLNNDINKLQKSFDKCFK